MSLAWANLLQPGDFLFGLAHAVAHFSNSSRERCAANRTARFPA